MRWLIIASAAAFLAGCSENASNALTEAAERMNPQVAAHNHLKRTQVAYGQSVEDYKRCLAASPAAACEGQRAIMQANQQVLSAATTAATPPTVVSGPVGPRTCTTSGLPGMSTTNCY